MRATVPVVLMRQGSPPQKTACKKLSPPQSPTIYFPYDGPKNKSRQSPEQRISPETKSSGSPGLKECKGCGKPRSLLGGLVRRTASLDTIYLSGQWPRDLHSYCGRPMVDSATQTPEDWKEVERLRFAQKKGTLNTVGDPFEIKFIRQRLQRTTTQGGRTSPRSSPVQGDHQVVLGAPLLSPLSPPCCLLQRTGPISIPTQQQQGSSPHGGGPASRAGGAPPLVPRMHNSVEGLNQEIERLVLRGISGNDNEAELERVMGPTPEGHRAPISEMFHSTCSVDTQTPCDEGGIFFDASRPTSRECNTSASPEYETRSGSACKLGTSPQINKFLAREPPDGCEKVKIVDEGRKPTAGDPMDSVPKPSSQFVLQPSQSSAFCPLARNPPRVGAPRDTDAFPLDERLQ